MSTDVQADTTVIKALKRLRMPQTQRNREFWLLLFACAISGAALTLVQLGALGVIDPMILAIGGGLAVLAFALHIVLRFVASDADPFVLRALEAAGVPVLDLGIDNYNPDGTGDATIDAAMAAFLDGPAAERAKRRLG